MRRTKKYPLQRQEAVSQQELKPEMPWIGHQIPEITEDDIQSAADPAKLIHLQDSRNMYMINPDLFCIFNRPVLRSVPIKPASHKCQLSAEDTSRDPKPAVFGDTFIFSNSFDGYISPTLLGKYGEAPCEIESTDKENIPLVIGGSADAEPHSQSENRDLISIFINAPPDNVQTSTPKSKEPQTTTDANLNTPYVSPLKKDVFSFFFTDSQRRKAIAEEENQRTVSSTERVGETEGEPLPDSLTTEISLCTNSNKDILSFSTTPAKDLVEDTTHPLSRNASFPPPESSLRKPYVSLNFSDILAFFNSEESLLEACENDNAALEGCDLPLSPEGIEQAETQAIDNQNDNPDCLIFLNSGSLLPLPVPEPLTNSTPVITRTQSRSPLLFKKGSILSFYSDEDSFEHASELDKDADRISEIRERAGSIGNQDVADAEEISTSLHNYDIKVFENNKVGTGDNWETPADKNIKKQLRSSSPILVVTQEFPDIISFYNPDNDDSDLDYLKEVEIETENLKRARSLEASEFGTVEISLVSDEFPVPAFDDPDESAIGSSKQPDMKRESFSSGLPWPKISDLCRFTIKSDDELEIKMETPRRLPTLETAESSSVELSSTNDAVEVTKPEFDEAYVGCGQQMELKKKTSRRLPTLDVLESSTIDTSLTDDDDDLEFPEPPDSPTCLSISGNVEICDQLADKDLDLYPPPFIEDIDHPIEAYLNEYSFDNDEKSGVFDYDEESIPGLEEFEEITKDEDFQYVSSVVVEDSCSDDGTPIRDIQYIENLPDIEQAIDMIAAINEFEMLELEVCAPDRLGEQLYRYGDDDLEKDLTDEIDSLLSEAEQSIALIERDQDWYVDDDLDRFFEDVADPEEHLLNSDDDDVPQTLSISVVIPCGNNENDSIDDVTVTATLTNTSQQIETRDGCPTDTCYLEDVSTEDIGIAEIDPKILEDVSTEDIGIAEINPIILENQAASTATEMLQSSSKIFTEPPYCPVLELSGYQEASATNSEADIDSETELNPMHEPLNRPILPPISRVSPDKVTISHGAHTTAAGMLVLAPVTYQRVFPFDWELSQQHLFERMIPRRPVESSAHIEEVQEVESHIEEVQEVESHIEEVQEVESHIERVDDVRQLSPSCETQEEEVEFSNVKVEDKSEVVPTSERGMEDLIEEIEIIDSHDIQEVKPECSEYQDNAEGTERVPTPAGDEDNAEGGPTPSVDQITPDQITPGVRWVPTLREAMLKNIVKAASIKAKIENSYEMKSESDNHAQEGALSCTKKDVPEEKPTYEFVKSRSTIKAWTYKLAENYMKQEGRHLSGISSNRKKAGSLNQDNVQKLKSGYSPFGNLGKMVAERMNSRGDLLVKSKKARPSFSRANIIKFDKKLFSDLQQKFSASEERINNLRLKYKRRCRVPSSWVPHEVIPHQVDISYSEVNPVDVEVQIPDLDERRTPIAKLFNDASSSAAQSSGSPSTRIVSPRPNVFVPIETAPSTPLKRKYPAIKIIGKVAMYEELSKVDSKCRPVSPGPESRFLGSLENLSEDPTNGHDSECVNQASKLTIQNKDWVSEDSGIYNGSLRPVSARKPSSMFQPSWRKDSPELSVEERAQSTSPHWQSFSEAAFGVNLESTDNLEVTGNFGSTSNLASTEISRSTVDVESDGIEETIAISNQETIASGTYSSKPSSPTMRLRNLSTDSNRESITPHNQSYGSTTHVDRLARSGSAASLAVVMASTFPNGGNANFDLEGTAAKISEVCKSLTNSQSDMTSCGTVHLTRSRSMNSVNFVSNSDFKKPARPLFLDKNIPNKLKIRSATTPERRVAEAMKAKKPIPSFKEIKDLQEKLKDVTTITYTDLMTCPRHRLPPHIDKLRLQDYLSDAEFVDVFKIAREQFTNLAVWRQTQLKKEVLLF